MVNKIKSVHGHYSDVFEEEAKRIQKLYKDVLEINDVSFTEATAIAAQRSVNNFMTDKQLREVLARLRGVL